MPIFDYKCPACQHEKEAIVKNSEVKITCPNCNTQMTKQVCSPTFSLRGEGFYSSGTYQKAVEKGPHIPNEIKEMSDVELNRSLGLPDDH